LQDHTTAQTVGVSMRNFDVTTKTTVAIGRMN